MMHKDPIVEEVRKHRQEWAAKFDYNIEAMAADLRKREGSDGHRVINLQAAAKRRAWRTRKTIKAKAKC